MSEELQSDGLLALTARIVSAHVSHNSITSDAIPALIMSVYQTLAGVGTVVSEPEKPEPAVPVKKSVFPSHLVCLGCGKSFSMMKRHLKTDHAMTPDAYRAYWALPATYPMVAPDYAATRSALAKDIGLGRKRAAVTAAPEPETEASELTKAADPSARPTTIKKQTSKKASATIAAPEVTRIPENKRGRPKKNA